MPVVMFEPSGATLFDNGARRCWQGVQSAAAAMANHYIETGRQGLAIHYSAEYAHAPLILEPGLCDAKLTLFFGHWASEVQHGLGEVI